MVNNRTSTPISVLIYYRNNGQRTIHEMSEVHKKCPEAVSVEREE